jgi:hypothetical protein
MSDTQVSKSNSLLTFLGSLGALLIFVLIVLIAYLPNRPDPVKAEASATRLAKAEESRAAGIQKITTFEVLDKEAGMVRIPVKDAMEFTVAAYSRGSDLFKPVPAEVPAVSVAESEALIETAEPAAEEGTPESD